MPEAVFTQTDVTEVGRTWLDQLKHDAQTAPLGRARLCLHRDHADAIQEMVIAFCRGSLVRPHRHEGRCESLHVIEGSLAVLLFDDAGRVDRRIDLAAPPMGDAPFMYRLSASLWHAVVPLSDSVVVHEVTQGPFVADTPGAFAPWSPTGGRELAAFLEAALAETRGHG